MLIVFVHLTMFKPKMKCLVAVFQHDIKTLKNII